MIDSAVTAQLLRGTAAPTISAVLLLQLSHHSS